MLPTSFPTSKFSSSTSMTTPATKPKRPAGPECCRLLRRQHPIRMRWAHPRGPRRVRDRASEWERAKGRVVLDRAELLDASRGFVGVCRDHVYGNGHGYAGAGAKYGGAHASTSMIISVDVYGTSGSMSKAYAFVERAGGWDILPEVSTNDLAGGTRRRMGTCDLAERSQGAHTRQYAATRDLTGVAARVDCLPMLRKRWKHGGGTAPAQTQAPPRVDKGKGNARAQDEEVMDVDFDVVATSAGAPDVACGSRCIVL
ncbi:hypothetical protein DFH09DRAFT_1323322 [Mycena vulgaris]|nr:hypothetical protein DFH09DRAFT_1323322 [Mycena vulgaris]